MIDGRLTLVTAPALEPVTVAEVKAYAHIDSGNAEPAPTAPTVALAGLGAGNVDTGAHRYKVTFVTADGETEGGEASAAVTTTAGNGQVSVSAIPIGGAAVTSRKLYRTTAGGSTYKLLATIANNTATTYADNIADSSLGADAPSTNTTADPLLVSFIKAAREHAESFLGRALITQTWDYKLRGFPIDGSEIKLPRPPLQSVTSITYTDADGVSQTWSASLYQAETPTSPWASFGHVRPVEGESYPTTKPLTYDAVKVRYLAGYGSAASSVPAGILNAVKAGVAELYDHRDQQLAFAAMDVLLEPYAVLEYV